MKRKIIKITASILSGILLVCVVLGSYAEMPDEDDAERTDFSEQAESSEPAEESETIAVTDATDSGEQRTERPDPPAAVNTEAVKEADKTELPEKTATTVTDVKNDEPATAVKSGETDPAGTVDKQEADPDETIEYEPEEASDDVTGDDTETEPDEDDGDGLIELDDDDPGFVEPDMIPETLANVTPEMRFEGITELQIGSEVSGTANEDKGTYHYIHSDRARTIVLTLKARADIRVQINDKPVSFEPAADEDGNACLECELTIRNGDTYIGLCGQSVSYRLKADVSLVEPETEEEITEPEEEIPETEEEIPETEGSDETDNAEQNEEVEEPVETGTSAEAGDDPDQAAGEPETAAEIQPDEPDIERYIIVHSSVEGQKRIYTNSYVKLTAEPVGYDGTEYTVQWYYSPDGGDTQIPIPGANSLKYVYQINNENLHYIWSVKVTPVDG